MVDDRLRELERAFRESGSVEHEVAWLRERVRCGELGEVRVRCAAHVGHPAAEAIVGRFEEGREGIDWASGLFGFGRTLIVGHPGRPVFAGPEWLSVDAFRADRAELASTGRLRPDTLRHMTQAS